MIKYTQYLLTDRLTNKDIQLLVKLLLFEFRLVKREPKILRTDMDIWWISIFSEVITFYLNINSAAVKKLTSGQIVPYFSIDFTVFVTAVSSLC